MFAFGLQPSNVLRDLTNEVWIRDNWDTRLVLADAYDELGRSDIAMLWRDELPRHRRRKHVNKLSQAEKDQIELNMHWVRQNVQYRTGSSDEQLALAAISCLYRAAARRFSNDVIYPRVTWLPAPSVVRHNILNAVGNRRDDLGEAIWAYRRSWNFEISYRVERFISDQRIDWRLEEQTQRAGDDEDMNMSGGLSGGQLNPMLLKSLAVIDVLRLYQGIDDDAINNELSLRAILALIRCTPFYYMFERACILSQHPTLIDADQPRWAWLDSKNNPYQWPTTR